MATNLNLPALAKDMLSAAKPILENYWKEVRPYLEKESKNFLQNLAMIAKLKTQGKISKEEALLHIQIQRNSFRTVLMAVEGLGILMVENILNAAIGAIRKAVNTAIGWTLL